MIARALFAVTLIGLVPQASLTYEQRLEQWRAARTVEVAGPEGWTTVVALHWLEQGDTRVGSAEFAKARLPASAPAFVGVVRVAGKAVRFEAAPGVDVTSKGVRVTTMAFTPDETTLQVGTYSLAVIARAGRIGLRVRDRQSAARTGFKGIAYFPVSSRHRVQARFVPFDTPRTATVINVIGDAVDFQSPGQLVFTLEGIEHRLDALFETPERKDLWVIFRDRTSGVTTYPAGRYLHAALPADGVVDLDFNVAYNPPCAFTDYATCPIPPRQNWLKAAVEAGERNYDVERPKPRASGVDGSSLGPRKPEV